MKEPVNKKIDGLNVTVQAWPARKAWRYQFFIGRTLKSAMIELGAALDGKDLSDGISEADINLEKVASAFGSYFSNVSDSDADKLLEVFIDGNVFIDNKNITEEMLDLLFQGNILTIYKIMWLVLEVNYGSFLEGNGIGKLLKKK